MPQPGADPIHAHVAQRLSDLVAPGTPVCVGYSGGVDSTVLLAILAGLRESTGIKLGAVHVHHGLSPHADSWAQSCAALCKSLEVPLAIARVAIDQSSPLGLEAAARKARHAVFAAQNVPVIALAHHLDDQAETVLLQLLRGTGIKGASAMAEWGVPAGAAFSVFRPLLPFTREALVEQAKARALQWSEDESNLSPRFDRNYLRLEVAPKLAERFPRWREALSRFARHAATSEGLLEALARVDGATDPAGLPLAALRELPRERQANALRAFLAQNGLAMPAEVRLAEMLKQLIEAPPDARVRIEHAGAVLVRFRDVVQVDAGAQAVAAGEAWRVRWQGEADLALGDGRGSVRFREARGEGIDAARLEAAGNESAWHFAPRAGGERLQLDARRPTRSLKNLLQENAVPSWQRERLPLLFQGEALVWVPGIGIAQSYQCPAGAPGRVPEWCWPA